jgi:hypothetical protein
MSNDFLIAKDGALCESTQNDLLVLAHRVFSQAVALIDIRLRTVLNPANQLYRSGPKKTNWANRLTPPVQMLSLNQFSLAEMIANGLEVLLVPPIQER